MVVATIQRHPGSSRPAFFSRRGVPPRGAGFYFLLHLACISPPPSPIRAAFVSGLYFFVSELQNGRWQSQFQGPLCVTSNSGKKNKIKY